MTYRVFSLQEGLQEIDTVHAEDFLDDGTPIKLAVTIDRTQGSAIFDFYGTGPEIYGNLNAPPAVTASAVIYCMRCLLPGKTSYGHKGLYCERQETARQLGKLR